MLIIKCNIVTNAVLMLLRYLLEISAGSMILSAPERTSLYELFRLNIGIYIILKK